LPSNSTAYIGAAAQRAQPVGELDLAALVGRGGGQDREEIGVST
jgi:hypothetical protein